jgi:hypothetical protein
MELRRPRRLIVFTFTMGTSGWRGRHGSIVTFDLTMELRRPRRRIVLHFDNGDVGVAGAACQRA